MKFRKFGKTVLTAALSSAIVFSLSSCVRSFSVGYLYVTGTVTGTPTGNGIISGFKIDNNTGKLTALHGLPVASGGANPVRIVLLLGGNFVYVLNQGANKEGNLDCTPSDPCLNSNITEFAVGGNGILTPQETFYTQGFNPMRLIQDASGAHLFALDHDAPGTTNPSLPSSSTNPNTYCATAGSTTGTCGDVTVFSVNSTTGRLTLVTNAQLTSSSGTQVTYFPVPADPIDFTLSGNYIFTLAGAPSASPSTIVTENGQTAFPYSLNVATGQLQIATNTPQVLNIAGGTEMGQGVAIVNANGTVYILDNDVDPTTGVPGQILSFRQSGTNGNLSPIVGGTVPDDSTETNPIYLIVESKGKFLYVANQQGYSSTNAAGIAAFTIDPSSAQLTEDPGSPVPYTGTGAVPQCLLEDPSNQYIYTANSGDSTVTGHVLDPNSGLLTQMKGSTGTFPLNGPATWCVATGRTN
jgi:6-phosphogluconolactonase (cycloisomerase 2 family)